MELTGTATIEEVTRRAAMDAGFVELKSEQLNAIMEFVHGRDVFNRFQLDSGSSLFLG